jgi:HEAT repeat protein
MSDGQPDEVVAGLLAVLRTGSAAKRRAAVWALAGLGAKAAGVVPGLVEALSDRDAFVRLEAARALRPLARAAVPALLTALQSEDGDIDFRRSVIVTLGQMGAAARPAIAKLTELLKDEELGAAAADALRQILEGHSTLDAAVLHRRLRWLVLIAVAATVLAGIVSAIVKPPSAFFPIAGGGAILAAAAIGALLLIRRGRITEPETAATWQALLLWTLVLCIGGSFLGALAGGLWSWVAQKIAS